MDLQELLAELHTKIGGDGASLKGAPGDDGKGAREPSAYVGENGDVATVLKAVAEGRIAFGNRAGGAGGIGVPGSPAVGKGFRPGHWSDPVAKAVQGDLKSLTTGTVTVPAISSGLVAMGDRALRILDLMPVDTLDGTDSFGFLRETKREHKAKETAPGTLKPTSKYGIELEEDKTVTIAHLSEPIQNQILSDVGLLRDYIDTAMVQGVLLRLDSQIMLGKGAGVELLGIGNDPDRHEVEWVGGGILHTARRAVGVLEDEELTGAFVLAPSVWEAIELLSLSTGDFVLEGPPVDRANKRLWGAPVITTTALADDPERGFYVDFEGSTELKERETVKVDWSDAPEGSVEGETAYETNEVIFRGEGRYGLARKRPRGFVEFEAVEPTE